MVNVMKGVLVECDPAMKQFLLHLDEKVSDVSAPLCRNRLKNGGGSMDRRSRFYPNVLADLVI